MALGGLAKDMTPLMVNKAAAYTFVPSDNGKWFLQTSATAGWTLPAVASIWDGWNVRIYNIGATSLIVTAPTGLFAGLNNAAATTATANTASNIIGAACEIIYNKAAAVYLLMQLGGTWVMS